MIKRILVITFAILFGIGIWKLVLWLGTNNSDASIIGTISSALIICTLIVSYLDDEF